jgi:hypothetical protein
VKINCVHQWEPNVVPLGKHGDKAMHREGYVCSGCKLVALPPKAGHKTKGWKPPK